VAVARERNRELREIAAEKKKAFAGSLVGTEVQAIMLQSRNGQFLEALTDNYLKMRLRGKAEANQWRRVMVERSEGETLVGRLTAEREEVVSRAPSVEVTQ
jgi:tRNA A37 methylthiotransferase MiaB